jgi:hypothetical protein
MQLPLLVFSELTLLVTVGAISLLIGSVLASFQYGLTNLTINKKKLRKAAIAASLLLIVAIGIKIINILIGS